MGVSPIWAGVAFFWGFSEATLFFVVPDVLLTLAAVLLGWRKAVALVFYTLAGALLGGAGMYVFAMQSLDSARAAVEAVPLIHTQVVSDVITSTEDAWLWEMFIGSLTGIPYKIYAISSPGAEVSFGMFLLGSIVVRPVRWFLVLMIAAAIASIFRRAGFERSLLPSWAALWVAFYAFYAVVMSG